MSTGLDIDGAHAAVIEKEEKATVYQQGLHYFVVYTNGRLAVLNEQRQFWGGRNERLSVSAYSANVLSADASDIAQAQQAVAHAQLMVDAV